MTDPDDTPAETLVRACEIGVRAGLRFVYAGNIPGGVGRWENTYCPACGDLLIERTGYVIRRQRVRADGRCPGAARTSPASGVRAAPAVAGRRGFRSPGHRGAL